MKVKYMGGADIRRIPKGTDFGGQLAEDAALDTDIEWNWDNNHVVDTESDELSGVHEEFWNLLLESEDFKDVSSLTRIPTNKAQQQWRGLPKTQTEQAAGVADDDPALAQAKAGSQSEASDTGAETTTTGGSTSGDSGSTVGGSTKGKTKKS